MNRIQLQFQKRKVVLSADRLREINTRCGRCTENHLNVTILAIIKGLFTFFTPLILRNRKNIG